MAKILEIPCFDDAVVRHRADDQRTDSFVPEQGRPAAGNSMSDHALHEGGAAGKCGAPWADRGKLYAY